MADTGIFATTAEVQYKAGLNASTVANTETYINSFMTQAESVINAMTLKNWSDVYSSLNVDKKGILKEAASCWAAMRVINYDMDSIGRNQAIVRLNFLRDSFLMCIAELRKEAARDFVAAA